jgi:hypothetical protein
MRRDVVPDQAAHHTDHQNMICRSGAARVTRCFHN